MSNNEQDTEATAEKRQRLKQRVWFVDGDQHVLATDTCLAHTDVTATECGECGETDIGYYGNWGDGASQKYKYACENCYARSVLYLERQAERTYYKGAVVLERR